MKLIKNNTPYLGKIKLKFEKYPEYSGSSILNKVHLNLGFTKLVSRMTPFYNKELGRTIDPEKIALIEKHTGGKIGTHVFSGGTLENSFLSNSGEYIGDIKDAWWYYQKELTVCDKYPHGVALVWDGWNHIGYYGYTHRGGQTFKISDRLFDENYEPKEEDYPEWQWAGFVEDFNKSYEKADELDKKWMNESGISYVIPFKLRGQKEIESDEEAMQAAINMSKYLS